jgi:type IV fimbrial biogenesis protein FimT
MQPMQPKQPKQPMQRMRPGHTLVELAVVLALVALLAGAAMPDLTALIRSQQLKGAVSDLHGAIDLARAQAIARGGRVMLVPLDPDGVTWRNGWIVFVDDNGNRRPDAGEAHLFEHGPLPDGIVITSAFSSGTPPWFVAYNGAGRSCSATNSLAAHWGTLTLRQGRATRNIKVGMLGRVRVCDPDVTPDSCSAAAD